MSGEDQEGTFRPPLVSREYDNVSSDEVNQPILEQELENDNLEHASLLSYETISETPFESSRGSASPDPVEENRGSQEIFPDERQGDLQPEQTETLMPPEGHDEMDQEGKFPTFFS